jgi:hypothetical protein
VAQRVPPPPSSPPLLPREPSSPVPVVPPLRELGAIPPTPVNTLRGMAIPQTGRGQGDSGASNPKPRRGYDPARIAQRDALVRRLVWFCILVIAPLTGLLLAALL